MKYESNTIQWRRGDIVIHHADAKQPDMLMRIIGFTRAGMPKTQYCCKDKPRKVYANDLKNLLNPEQFGINPDIGRWEQASIIRAQLNWDLVRHWNRKYEPGIEVYTTSADGGFFTRTTHAAYFNSGSEAMVHLEKGGNWSLLFVVTADELKQVAK